ncbi:methylenetetrahydrofolate reductase [Paeniglutamicibacter sp. MACA_103]|uniref:methylenetetrahydrofolate reductase n=1 Tax=Paeniglutamicibacter sp. MACA_103 TaxID=3377337 RepID=UPI0038957101
MEIPDHDPRPESRVLPQGGWYTLDVTGKGISQVQAARDLIPTKTPINIAFLGNEDHAQRINAARFIRECGYEPVPIISSRRLSSEKDRDELLGALIEAAAPSRFIFVGGDPAAPAGPYRDSIALLGSTVLERHSIRHVGIVGYPEGHLLIDTATLWSSLKWKIDSLQATGCSVEITTQFGFDADAVVRWLERLRHEGIEAPVRIGVPGPATVGKLVGFARQFGVEPSAEIARQYGLATDEPSQVIGAERFWDRLATGLAEGDLGSILYHLYPFGGMSEGVQWMNSHMAPNRTCT